MDIIICILVAVAILYCIAREDKALRFVNKWLMIFFLFGRVVKISLVQACLYIKSFAYRVSPKGRKHRKAVDKMYRFAELKTVGDMFRYEGTK